MTMQCEEYHPAQPIVTQLKELIQRNGRRKDFDEAIEIAKPQDI
jgi:hypothetical protein